MKIITRNFKETFDVLKAFKELSIDNLTFRTDLNGFRVKNASRTMISYLDVYFKASNFDVFELDNKTVGEVFTVDLKNFLDFTFNKTDRITLNSNALGQHLTLKAESETITTLNLDLLDNPKDELDVPIKTIKENTSLVEIDFKAFKNILKNYLKEEGVIFELKEDCFKLTTDRNQETKIFKGTDIIKEIRGNAKSKYSMEYLKLLNKLDVKTFTNIRIEFKTDFPIVFTLLNDNIKVEYMIAPRVSDNE